jgi:cyclase
MTGTSTPPQPAYESFYRGTVPPPTLQDFGDGIFAYLHHDGSWGLNNCGFVASGGDVAAIDSTLTEQRTRVLVETIKSVTGANPRTLINTHHHSDHTFGNSQFAGATIIAHTRCRDAVIATGLAPVKTDPLVPWGDLRLAPPTLVFEDIIDLYVGETHAELIYLGPAHTDNDIVVWLPDRRILFAGDLLFNHATPIITDGSLSGAERSLERMAALNPEVVVPGHGIVAGPELIGEWESYFRFLRRLAADAVAAGLTPLATAREADLGEFGEWQHPERLVLNLHRAMAELTGTPPGYKLDNPHPFGEMLELSPSAYGHKIIEGSEHYQYDPPTGSEC